MNIRGMIRREGFLPAGKGRTGVSGRPTRKCFGPAKGS